MAWWRTEAVVGLMRGLADSGRPDWHGVPVLADALDDAGAWLLAVECREGPPPLGLCFLARYGDGYGYGDGDGYGDGYGHGYGSGHGYGYGYGDGDGYGYGYGHGDGDGDGYGYGHGDGDGYGYGVLTLGGRVMPEVGKNQLIVLPHGWVICGYVAEHVGPYQFRVENAVVICRTGGVPWDQLASGTGDRTAPTYRKWGSVLIGPQFVMSTEWAGDLPATA